MQQMTDYNEFDPRTFELLSRYRELLNSIAETIRVHLEPHVDGAGNVTSYDTWPTAAAIAGPMAKENNPYQTLTDQEMRRDTFALKRPLCLGLSSRDCWDTYYKIADATGLIDRANRPAKLVLQLLLDFGPFNLQGATALRERNRYYEMFPDANNDPFGLRGYEDPQKFLEAISGIGVVYPMVSEEETVRLNAVTWGMRVVAMEQWVRDHLVYRERYLETGRNYSPAARFYWDYELTQPERDAIVGQAAILGPATMEKLFNENLIANPYYRPAPGGGNSGGQDILGNYPDILAALGLPSQSAITSRDWIFDPELERLPGMALTTEERLQLLKSISETTDGLIQRELIEEVLGAQSGEIQLNCILPACENEDGEPPSYCDARPIASPSAPAEHIVIDPLVLDLDGDGIQTTREGRSWAEGRAFFDHNADGFAERTGWVSGNDGLLVMDRNGDGLINNGKELFGSGTTLHTGGAATSGFQALADLDSNHDGIINANDAAFSQLQIWKDQDEDGFSFPSELHTLAELGITAINRSPTTPGCGKDAQGNTRGRAGGPSPGSWLRRQPPLRRGTGSRL